MTQLGGASSALKPLLLTLRFLLFLEEGQPFGMFEGACFGLGIKLLGTRLVVGRVPSRNALQVKRGAGQHAGLSFEWK